MEMYPVVLQLKGLPCLVVGGGGVAERKVRSLLAAEAAVTVIAPEVTAGLARLAEEGALLWKERRYRMGDLRPFFLAVAATDSPPANRRIYREATAARILVNSVDDPQNCNFHVPAVVRRGRLLLAVSTSGAAPLLSRELHRFFERMLPPELGEELERIGELRSGLLGAGRQAELEEALKPGIARILQKLERGEGP